MRKKEGPNPSCILEGCQYESLKAERDQLKEKVEGLHNINSSLIDQKISLTKDRDLWKKQAEDLYFSIDTWRSKAEIYESKANKLAEALKKMMEDSDGMRKEYSDLEEAMEIAKAALDEFGEGK